MDEKELGSIKGWFAGRLPDGWFTGVEVAVEDDQIVVIGTLPETNLGSSPEEKEGAAAGRIARFREETRGSRIGIAQEAEERFKKFVTWGAKLGGVSSKPRGSRKSSSETLPHSWGSAGRRPGMGPPAPTLPRSRGSTGRRPG